MKLKLELKESSGEDSRAGLGLELSAVCGREVRRWGLDVSLVALQSTWGRGGVTEQRKLLLIQEPHASFSGCC